MKFLLASAAMALGLGLAGVASAQGLQADDYAQINLGSGVGGRTNLNVSAGADGSASAHEGLSAGFFGSALVGHDFRNGASIEVEGYYANNDIDAHDLQNFYQTSVNARVQSYGGLVNLKLEAPKPYSLGGLAISPYVAGGVGYGGVNYRLAGASDSDGGFNWQLKAGLAIQTSSKLTWDLGYRYLTTAKYDTNDSSGDSLDARTHIHAVTLGARVKF